MNYRHLVLKSLIAALLLLNMAASRSDEPAKPEKAAADSMRGKAPGEVRDDNGLKMKLVWCPPGFFTMEQVDVNILEPLAGREDVKISPVKVLVSQGYWLGKYEVTQSEWKRVMATEPWSRDPFPKGIRGIQVNVKEGAGYPATFVTWDNAVEFCRKLTEQEHDAGRLPENWEYSLPTEVQWERACRARTETKYNFGDDESTLGDHAWFRDNARDAAEDYAHQVGQKKANAWGLFDMHGNVCEWCQDRFAVNLAGGADPAGPASSSFRVNRGGSFCDVARRCRSADRNGNTPSFRDDDLGFRIALSPVR